MFRTMLSAFALAFLVTGTALAADTQAAAPTLPAKATEGQMTAALDVLDAMNAKHTVEAMVDSMAPIVAAQIRQAHPTATDKTLAVFSSAFKEEMARNVDDLLKMQAAVYAEHFSEQDLKTLAAFYRSDVGKRFVDEQSVIVKEITPLAARWGQEAGQRAAQRAMEKLQKEGITL
jgi:uncharacterized protein